jgi:sugar lactone lactonase YvrE
MRNLIIILLVLSAFNLSCKKDSPYHIRKPESVVWNPVTQTYLISNAGSGIILSLKNKFEFFVFNKAKLVSPKGMAIQGNTLYVADLNRVVGFDLKKGKKTYELDIPGARFLNDVAAAPDNTIYISDTETNSIVILDPATNKLDFFRHKDLSRPNGLYFIRQDGTDFLYICSFRPNAPVQLLNLKTRELTSIPKTETTNADGITRETDGSWLVSSWADSTVYKYSPDFSVRSSLQDKYRSPADIFYSLENKELAIPEFETNLIKFISQADTTTTKKK